MMAPIQTTRVTRVHALMFMPFVKLAAARVPMKSLSCFKDFCLLFTRPACLLFAIATLATPAWSHPDLLAQIENLTAELQQQPADAELLIKRGDLYRRDADYTAAAQDFTAARAIQPHHPLLDFYQGRLQLEMADPAAAEGLLKRYLAAHPEHAGAWVLLGQARLGLNQAEAAAEDYAQAIRRSARPSPSLYRLQVLALLTAGEQHWDAARMVVDAGLGRFPQEVSLLGLGTDIALAQNSPDIASGYIETLPQAVLNLERWQSRLKLQQCLGEKTADAGVAGSSCLQTAMDVLKEQLVQRIR